LRHAREIMFTVSFLQMGKLKPNDLLKFTEIVRIKTNTNIQVFIPNLVCIAILYLKKE
jgi:hypothetical protein